MKTSFATDGKTKLRIPYEAAHLSHMSKDVRNLNTNEALFYKFTRMNQTELSRIIKESCVGKRSEPTVINV